MTKNKSMIDRLADFYRNLNNYQTYRIWYQENRLKQGQYREMTDLREWLLQESGALGPLISELTGKDTITIYEFGQSRSVDMWGLGLRPKFDDDTSDALSICIDYTNRAIGKLADDIDKGVRDKQGKLIKKPPELSKKPAEDTGELPSYLFDLMQFHPRIRRASKSLFNSGHYAEAIFAAFKAVNNFTKKKAGLSLDGKDLMAKTFTEDKPIIKLNKLLTRSELDEQEGFRFLFMGAMVGIRNPKAHDEIRQINLYRTLEYLAFASLLMRRVTEGKLESGNKCLNHLKS